MLPISFPILNSPLSSAPHILGPFLFHRLPPTPALPSSSSVLSSFSDPCSIPSRSQLASCLPPDVQSLQSSVSHSTSTYISVSHPQAFISSEAPLTLSLSHAPLSLFSPLILSQFSPSSSVSSILSLPHPLLSLLSPLIHPQPPLSPQVLHNPSPPQVPLILPVALPLSLPISIGLAQPPSPLHVKLAVSESCHGSALFVDLHSRIGCKSKVVFVVIKGVNATSGAGLVNHGQSFSAWRGTWDKGLEGQDKRE